MAGRINPVEVARKKLVDNGQSHVLDLLAPEQFSAENPIVKQLIRLDVVGTLRSFEEAKALLTTTASSSRDDTQPMPGVFTWAEADPSEQDSIEALGTSAIRNGEVAVIILSGGQGTRLGFHGPKGMYKVGLPSDKSIFQLHVEKVARMRALCSKEDGSLPRIPIYIMTSDLNHNTIVHYFKENNYFGYPREDVEFFEQGLELCLTKDGKIIVESSTSLALAPDGNGGIFTALRVSGALDDIVARGVRHLHVYGIDNIMTRAADPRFVGLCIRDNAEVGNKVVPRLSKDEKVGVTVIRHGRMFVAEYSELPPEIASSVNPATGHLLFDAANICNHYFSVDFVKTTLMSNLSGMYHLASKKIPYMNDEGVTVTPTVDNGYKLEMFIFDCFPLATRFSVLSGQRDDEFAPVKNHPGAPTDTPESAVAMLSRQGLRWLREAGAVIAWKRRTDDIPEGESNFAEEDLQAAITRGDVVCEISPLLSYGGENLDTFRGQRIVLPCSI